VKYPFLLLILGISGFSHGGSLPVWVRTRLNADLNPLSKESDALLVYGQDEISLRDGKLMIHTREIYQLTRSQGTSYGSLILFLDKKSKASNIKGWRFTPEGEVLEVLKRDQIKKRAYNTSFYDDNKQIFASFDHVSKGDWVAFEYTQAQSSFFNDLVWVMGMKIDILEKRTQVAEGLSTTLLNNVNDAVKQTGTTFTMDHWVAPYYEPGAPNMNTHFPALGIVWDRSAHDSWQEFGQKYQEMTNHLASFSGKMEPALEKILADPDPASKIKSICEYVQQGINYVDIEFGKGGYIPRSCDSVHQKKYGDCKDMAFYAVSLFRKAGITAHPALALGRTWGKVYTDFVGNQFNHVIAAVELPPEADSLRNLVIDDQAYMFVDLTDCFTPVPMLPLGLEGSQSLLIKKNGSRMVQFPYSNPEMNRLEYHLKLHLDAAQTLHVEMETVETGHFYSSSNRFLKSISQDKRKEQLANYIDRIVPGAQLETYQVTPSPDTDSVTFKYSFSLRYYGIDSSDGLLVIPNLIDLKKKRFKKRHRKQPYLLSPLRTVLVEMDFTWDKQWTVISTPPSVEETTDYFSGSYRVTTSPQSIHLTKNMKWLQPAVPAEDYSANRKKYRILRKAFNGPIVIKQATP